MAERGVYQNANRGRQLLRFDGFQYGTITPTDIDAVIEYHDQIWVLFEAKLIGKAVPNGQRTLLERGIHDAVKAKKHGIALIVEHSVNDPNKDIILKDCMVREVYTTEDMRWRPPKWTINAKDMTDAYINHYAKGA